MCASYTPTIFSQNKYYLMYLQGRKVLEEVKTGMAEQAL